MSSITTPFIFARLSWVLVVAGALTPVATVRLRCAFMVAASS
jgi:hypothetical protein